MARTDTLTNFLTDVAAAIRTKKGDNTAIPAANFDTEIVNLPSNTTLISLIDRTVTSFEIPEGTTSIGSAAFSCCTGLTSVTIPDSVTSIGNQAFSDCYGLTSITIPNSVTSIGSSAFNYCTGLTSIMIPDSVTDIGNSAFYNCSNLTSITIPGSVTSVGNRAFYSCTDLTKINWNAENVSNFTDTSKVFYDAGTAGSGIDVVFGNNVKSIPAYAFDGCSSLTSATIGNSVISVGNRAFKDCTGLTKINWNAESVSNFTYSSEVFYNAGTTGNGIDVVFNDSVKSIPAYAFYVSDSSYRPKIKSVTIGNSVKTIGSSAFSGCTGLTKINWNAENVNAFSSDSKVFYNAGTAGAGIDVVFGDNVKSIPVNAFYISDSSYRPKLTSVTIGNNVTSIGSSAFKDCSSLTSATIGNSVTGISESAFRDCTSLTSVTIGNSVEEIYRDAFSGCISLESITIPDSVRIVNINAFYGCSGLTSATIGNSVKVIENAAFDGCSSLTSVTIGNSVTSVGNRAFYNCTGLNKINWNAENVSNFTDISQVFYNAGTAGAGIDVVFGDNVKRIPEYAFYIADSSYRPKIKSVTIGNSVTSIGNYAFRDCTSLISVTIGNSVTSIGNQAFFSCRGLTSITIPNSVTSIGNSAFGDCTSLTSVTIPNSVTSIGNYAFSYCTSLTNVTIGNSVTSIGSGAFSSCTGLTKIDFSTHTTVPTLEAIDAFNNTPANLVIKVPSTLLDEWKAATNWSTYADKIMGV